MNDLTSDKPLGSIGSYKLLSSIAKGGMGEVFLAFDPSSRRQVALKQMREDFIHNKTMRERFLREARLASQLTHPSIIPIYAIDQDQERIFYTMPYVEGETLKQILRTSRDLEKRGEGGHPIGSSIPALIRIFLSVCQAIAYTHSKKILHRDLKPENVIIGKFGEVLILDWGLADYIEHPSQEEGLDLAFEEDFADLTLPGKIPGTLTYLPPERALGEPSSVSTDIYALGVMLYQLLTLRLPFQRTTLALFRKQMQQERLLDPLEAAPYRDIPLQLSDMAKKCLAFSKQDRYQSVQEMIADLENYIEGKPEWIPAATLDIYQKQDWEFQENVLLAKHIAITRSTDVMEWVSLMVSKASFSGNIKVEAKIRLSSHCSGLGFLLSIPDFLERNGLEEGDCLWINAHVKLFRSNVEVMDIKESGLKTGQWHKIRIEKSRHHLRFFLDEVLTLNYLSHLPMAGTHVGLLYRDADFEIEDFRIFASTQNVMVNCLCIPDAFLAAKEFSKALVEYRWIAFSFPGRAEGREALFRAGITLLEEAQQEKQTKKRQALFILALEEFTKLHGTPGAPLEYLGKSLVYKAWHDLEEEIKCLELAIRKYPKHPLLPILIEHIVFRLHESSHRDRMAAYQFALLALRHLPQIFTNSDNQRLLESLQKHWEVLPFIDLSLANSENKSSFISLQLAFWLAKPITLVEIIETTSQKQMQEEALFCLLKLGCISWTRENLDLLKKHAEDFKWIEIALLCHEKGLTSAFEHFFEEVATSLTFKEARVLLHLFEQGIDTAKHPLLLPYFERVKTFSLSFEDRLRLDALHIWTLFLKGDLKAAQEILERYPIELMQHETTPFYFLLGCFLYMTEGKEVAEAHFMGVMEVPYPPTPALLSYYFTGKIDLKKGWITGAFFWEKLQLYRELSLFYRCIKEKKMASFFQKRLTNELKSVQALYPSS